MRDKMEHALHKYKDRSHLPFFIIFCLFLACRVLLTIPAWTNEALIIIKPIKTDLQSGFIWGAVLYTTYLILSSGWRPWKIAGLLAILASAAPLLYVPLENSRNFDVIMSAVLIGLSFGRSFHRIIRLMLITYVSAPLLKGDL